MLPVSLVAQDILVSKSGEKTKVKVLEIAPDKISYKKYGNENGPTYTVNKFDVTSIIYENGESEDFKMDGSSNKRMFILPPFEKKITLPSLSLPNDFEVCIIDNRKSPPAKSEVEFTSAELIDLVKSSFSGSTTGKIKFVGSPKDITSDKSAIINIEAYDATFYPGAWHGQTRYFVETNIDGDISKKEIEVTKDAFNALGRSNIRGVLTRSYSEATAELFKFLNTLMVVN